MTDDTQNIIAINSWVLDHRGMVQLNSTPHSWRHKRACKALLDWYSVKQHALSLKNTLLESSLQKTRSPIFPCPCSRASSYQVQLHLDNRLLGNSNSPLIRTERESPGLTSYIYCRFNLENPKPRSQQCFVAPFLCISPMILMWCCKVLSVNKVEVEVEDFIQGKRFHALSVRNSIP